MTSIETNQTKAMQKKKKKKRMTLNVIPLVLTHNIKFLPKIAKGCMEQKCHIHDQSSLSDTAYAVV